MNPSQIESLIRASVGDSEFNKFGWEFRSKLVLPPVPIEVANPDGSKEHVFLVLDEIPNGTGYRVVYCPEDNEFGLVTSGTLIGIYGDFMNALNSM
jgi:hypothetical protein